MGKFTIVHSENKEDKIKQCERLIERNKCWLRQQLSDVENMKADIKNDKWNQDKLAKLCLSSVMVLKTSVKLDTFFEEEILFKEITVKFQMIQFIVDMIGELTVRTLVQTFPISKDYDGEKWGCKDYFYTMDVLSKMDWDKPIGKENVFDLLWDYENRDLRFLCVEYMTAMSDIRKMQTGKSLAEEFFEKNEIDVPTVTINEELKIAKDNKTGKITRLKPNSHLQIVK